MIIPLDQARKTKRGVVRSEPSAFHIVRHWYSDDSPCIAIAIDADASDWTFPKAGRSHLHTAMTAQELVSLISGLMAFLEIDGVAAVIGRLLVDLERRKSASSAEQASEERRDIEKLPIEVETKARLPIGGPGEPFYVVIKEAADGRISFKYTDRSGKILDGMPVITDAPSFEVAHRQMLNVMRSKKSK